MKKILLSLSVLLSFLLTSCYNAVLYNIRGDVKPESAEICGSIQTITRYSVGSQEFLVLIAKTNNNPNAKIFSENVDSTKIFYKPITSTKHGEWKIYENEPIAKKHSYDYAESKHIGEQMILSHATSDTLYIASAEYSVDTEDGISYPSKFHLYAKQISLNADGTWNTDGDWKDILDDGSNKVYFPLYKYDDYYHSAFSLFSTNAVQPSHRKVYFRTGDEKASVSDYKTVTYYEVSGLNPPVPVDISACDSKDNNINSAAYFGGTTVFFNSLTSTTNETADKDATKLYYGKGSYVYSKGLTDTEFVKSDFKTGNPVSCLCVCSDSLLIGRADYSSTNYSAQGGIVKTSLDENGNIGSELTSFENNAELQLSSIYFILSLINATPSATESDSILYSTIDFFGTGTTSSVNYDNIGLWSYYPNRGNWNRE